jgi:DNA-directed RNA polymerase II subunit RPB1
LIAKTKAAILPPEISTSLAAASAVPPVAIRPSIRADFLASATYEDDLTHKLADIIKTNEKLRKQKEKELISGEKAKNYSNDLHNFLQYHVATYFENDKDSFLTSEQKVGGKKFKSISERIKGKPGRIRGNLMGKRVNFSARSVITSDPNLKLHELGIPKKIAMEITFPEVVTAYNIERLSKLVRNGKYIYPGANFVIQGSSLGDDNMREYDLRYRKITIKLRYGDIVERHLVNGDPVLFNRQPSLHKLSMMCHLANVIDNDNFNTFRLNVNVTEPYNADFDGDEMNMFAPQSIQTQAELFKIADVRRQIISPKDSKPIIGPVQDSVLGSYRMTQDDIKIDWHDYMNLVVYIRKNENTQFDLDKIKFVKNKTYTGIELFNNIIPNNINVDLGNVKIRNGNILNGPVKKGINNTIISNCWDRHGHEITQTYIAEHIFSQESFL